MNRYLLGFAMTCLIVGGVFYGGMRYERSLRPAAPDLTAILAERDAQVAKLKGELDVADVKAELARKAADRARGLAGEHAARGKVLAAAPLDTGKDLDLKLSRLYPSVKSFEGGYLFTERDAGQAVRWAERYSVCLDEGTELAREALSLRGQVEAMATARMALDAHMVERDALLERGKAAYDAQLLAEARKTRAQKWKTRLWMGIAGLAVGAAAYSQ